MCRAFSFWRSFCRGDVTYRDAHLAMKFIVDYGQMCSFELVEVNLILDEHNHTTELAVELACSAFGKKIR
jgi:arginase